MDLKDQIEKLKAMVLELSLDNLDKEFNSERFIYSKRIRQLKEQVLEEYMKHQKQIETNKKLKQELQELRLDLSRVENEKREQEKKFYNAFSEYLKHYKRIRVSTGIELPNPFNVSDIDPTEYAAHIVNKEEA
jgi:predicted nuclease with TOPRIM domain